MGPSIPGSVVSIARTVGRWLLEPLGSPRFTDSRSPTMTECSSTKTSDAQSVDENLSQGEALLSITLTKKDNGVSSVAFCASFAISGSSVPEVLKFLFALPLTSRTRQQYTHSGEK